jgi:hypothetical protein
MVVLAENVGKQAGPTGQPGRFGQAVLSRWLIDRRFARTPTA